MKILILFFVTSLLLFSQDEPARQNVELPEFVITGRDAFELPTVVKDKPDPISLLNESFLKPNFPLDVIDVDEFSDPLAKNFAKEDSFYFHQGKVDFYLGYNTIPKISSNYFYQFGRSKLSFFADANQLRAYENNSNRFNLSSLVKFDNNFAMDNRYLPGVDLSLTGGYNLDQFRMFASADPTYRRSITSVDGKLNVKNIRSSNFIYSFSAENNYSQISADSFSENLFSVSGLTKFLFPNFEINSSVMFQSQSLDNVFIQNKTNNYLEINSDLGLTLYSLMKIRFGFEFSRVDTNTRFTPTLEATIAIDKGLNAFVKYKPESEFLSVKNILNKNRFFDVNSLGYFFNKKSSYLSFGVKYEYQTMFEVSGGFFSYSSLNYPYFTDVKRKGFFELLNTDASNAGLLLNFHFHPSKFGSLYTELKIEDVRDTANNKVPYNPAFMSKIFYSLSPIEKWKFDVGMKYFSSSYADIKNEVEISGFTNLFINVYYNFANNLEAMIKLNNLLNQKIYFYKDYREEPFDILLGVRYTL